MISIVLADDQPLVRMGLRRIFDRRHGFDVIAEAGDGAEAVEMAEKLHPDVVVMDMRMPGTNGAAAIRQIREMDVPPPVLVLTTFDDTETVHEAVTAGAAGFALKDSSADDLHRAVREIASGNGWIDFSVARPLLETFGEVVPPPERRAKLSLLTERELHVLKLLGRGRTNSEIAEELCVSTGTVKTHVGSILANPSIEKSHPSGQGRGLGYRRDVACLQGRQRRGRQRSTAVSRWISMATGWA